MLSWIFKQIANLTKPKPTPAEQAEAALRYIESGPREIAFEKALKIAYAGKKAGEWIKQHENMWRAFNTAATVEAKTALVLQWHQAWDPSTKKVAITGFDYPPGEFDGFRSTGFSEETLEAPNGKATFIHYRIYS